MSTIRIIERFIESNSTLERFVKEILERVPIRFRYGMSYGPTFRYWLGFLMESEKWDRDRLMAYQLEQMKNLLIHAGNNVPYYKRIFAEYGFRPEKFADLEDLKILPYIDRQIVKKHYEDFIATNIPKKRLIAATTSGSTGVPLIVYGTKETEEKHWATVVNLWNRIGYCPESKTIFFEADVRKGKTSVPYKKYANKLIISSNYFIDIWIDEFVRLINDFRPEYIIGFPHTIAAFASHIKRLGQSIYNGLNGIIVYAENLYKWQREIIENILGARILSDYGMAEKVIHGGGCEHSDAYHLYPQYGYTEYFKLKDSCYEFVATGFTNYAMPLIRYRTGDTCAAVNDGCLSCGRNYDIVTNIEGRISDFLVNREGEIFSVYLNIDYDTLRDIDRFQLYQDTPGYVELKIWPRHKNVDIEMVANAINSCFGPHRDRIKLKIAVMDHRELHNSVKFKMIDQRLDMRNFLT